MTTVKRSLDDLAVSQKRLDEIKAIKDEDIDLSDIPELGEEFWAKAELRSPVSKKGVYIRLDSDVLDWLKSQGKGYQTRINTILRSYYEAKKSA